MRQLFLLSAAALWAGCGGPKIQQFDVTPRRICAGQPVAITFKTKGEPRLSVVRRGTAQSDTTTYTIVAQGSKDTAYSKMDVITFGSDQTLVFTTELLGRDSLVARDTLPGDAWASMKIGALIADSTRSLVVMHGGRSALLKAGGGAQTEWRDLPVAGAWEIHSGLLHGEIPGNASRHPPAHLSFRMSLACAEGGQP